MPPLFGYHIPSFTFPATPPDRLFEHVVELAVAAEAAGFGLVTVMDHFYQIPGVGAETEPMLEAYSTLAALAARTTSVRLGALVTGVTYRNPAILAKTVTTLDVISGGRAILGIGAAWNEDEHRGYGVEFPPVRERMDRLDEALTICRAMFTETAELRDTTASLRAQRPRPSARRPADPRRRQRKKRTLKLAAFFADITKGSAPRRPLCWPSSMPTADRGQGSGQILAHCLGPIVLADGSGQSRRSGRAPRRVAALSPRDGLPAAELAAADAGWRVHLPQRPTRTPEAVAR
jgi:hypothetical protein